jgi:AcrR family transcriptional regulator
LTLLSLIGKFLSVIGKTASPRATRRDERIAAIIAAAWKLARERGIGGVSLHALAREVGIRQPSLYAYFDSKHALYDALFADGNEQLLARLESVALPDEPRAAVKAFMRAFVTFAVEDPDRANLLFQRPIPGFQPTPAAYEPAQGVLALGVGRLQAAGVSTPDHVDGYVAMIAGLIDAQISNDPGGDRWTRHLDALTDMYLDNFERKA